MRGPESDFYQRLKRNMTDFVFQRIETTTQAGVFDVVFHHENAMGWMELKVAPNAMSAAQNAWCTGIKAVCPNLFCLTYYPVKKQIALEHLNTKRRWVFDERNRTFDWSKLTDQILFYSRQFA